MIRLRQSTGVAVALVLAFSARLGWAEATNGDPCRPYEVYSACIEDAYESQPQDSFFASLSDIVAACMQRAGFPPVNRSPEEIARAQDAPIKSPDQLTCGVVSDPVVTIRRAP